MERVQVKEGVLERTQIIIRPLEIQKNSKVEDKLKLNRWAMNNTISIKFMAIFVAVLMLVSCTTIPPSPKKPRESTRIYINKTLPIEVDETTR
jgi:hypothetical protein